MLGSKGIKGICSALTILLVAMWIFVALMNVRAVWRGDILWPGMDEDMEDVEGHGHDVEDEELRETERSGRGNRTPREDVTWV